MDKRFLVTYLSTEGRFDYCWFETEKEMKDFISYNNYIDEVQDCIEIKEARDIDYSKHKILFKVRK